VEQDLKLSADGSHTVYSRQFDEHYHSLHGAVSESRHVFIQAGLHYASALFNPLSILEVGLGTGLNCLLSCMDPSVAAIAVHYTALEAYPLEPSVYSSLNYPDTFGGKDAKPVLNRIHSLPWEEESSLCEGFTLLKQRIKLEEYTTTRQFHLVYYDAFSPGTQPELWTSEVFAGLRRRMYPGGVLVTYCSKGEVKRNLKKAGFRVEALPGPPRKREMTRAICP
jgi:tRNA U34 5-methylaminomethyl-2-thiouridine-forming methyltransferase MnmC